MRSIKVEFYLSIGFHNANQEETVTIFEDEVDLDNKEELTKYLDQYLEDWKNNYIEYGYEIVESDTDNG